MMQTRYRRMLSLGVLAYGALLVYGTLFPWQGWQPPTASIWRLLFSRPERISFADMVTNILVYLPLGLLCAWRVAARHGASVALLAAVLVGGSLSLTLELIQAYLPHRVCSLFDLVLNIGGTFGGALLAVIISHDSRVGRRLWQARAALFVNGGAANLGLVVLGLWILAQLSPLVPSLDVGNLRNGVKLIWHTLTGARPLLIAQVAVYALSIAAISLLFHELLRLRTSRSFWTLGFVSTVLLLKVPIVSRQLSPEALCGLAIGAAILVLVRLLQLRHRGRLICLLVLAAVVVEARRVGVETGAATRAFNWVPFRGHLSNNLTGIIDILGNLWPYVALSYVAISRLRPGRVAVALAGGAAIFLLVACLEWFQQSLPGRYPDITDAVLAFCAWVAPWITYRRADFRAARRDRGSGSRDPHARRSRQR